MKQSMLFIIFPWEPYFPRTRVYFRVLGCVRFLVVVIHIIMTV